MSDRVPRLTSRRALAATGLNRQIVSRSGNDDDPRDSLDTAGRRGENVSLSANDKDERADEEDDCRQKVRKPESDVFLGVDHADLSGERADVDEHVKVHEESSATI